MAKGKFIFAGENIPYKNLSTTVAIKYNDIVNLMTRIGIAAADIPPSGEGTLFTTGVWELPAINTAAFMVGMAVYWDDLTGKITNTTSGSTVPAGWVIAPKTASGTSVKVKIG